MSYNSIFITLDNTPDIIPVASGFFTRFLGETTGKTFMIDGVGGAQNLDAGTNVFFGDIDSSEVTVTRDGTTLRITNGNDDLLAQIAAHPTQISTIMFADGGSELKVENGKLSFGGQLFDDGMSFTGEELQLEIDPQLEVNLDDLGGTVTDPASYDADQYSFTFVDDIARVSNTEIDHFTSDDKITLKGLTSDDVDVKTNGGEVMIEFDNGGGTVSQIVLLGMIGSYYTVEDFNDNDNYGDINFI